MSADEIDGLCCGRVTVLVKMLAVPTPGLLKVLDWATPEAAGSGLPQHGVRTATLSVCVTGPRLSVVVTGPAAYAPPAVVPRTADAARDSVATRAANRGK